MRPTSETLNDFEAAVLAALEQTPEKTILAADLVRSFQPASAGHPVFPDWRGWSGADSCEQAGLPAGS
jgi:hypothetical protein